jgi:hypothetical protein
MNRTSPAETTTNSLVGHSASAVSTVADAAEGMWNEYRAWFNAKLESFEAMAARADPKHLPEDELLGKDGSIERVAGILGDSPTTIRRYYAKWTPEFQTLQDDLIRKIHGTHLAQAQKEARTC